MTSFRSSFASLLVAAGLMLGAAAPALAGDVSFVESHAYTTNIDALDGLMAPITPFIGGANHATAGQGGTGNYSTAQIVGSGNFSVIGQAGSGNTAAQLIEGNNNALLLAQGGTGNNVLQVAKGDNDFQLLGVSGTSNNVAYVQLGDDLKGAMNVSGSNSAVLAFQGPQSQKYMMPTGLTGLNNQLVIVVPGRMYVFNLNQIH